MKNQVKKYKILVLSDLKKDLDSTLNSAIDMAKMVNGSVDLLSVRKPTEIVNKESQLSAVRNFNKQYITTVNKTKKILEPISKDLGSKINFHFSIGNLKNEITEQIKNLNPDIIVLGKRKAKGIKILGDNLAEFLVKNFNGALLICTENKLLDKDNSLSLGLYNANSKTNFSFLEAILSKVNKPIKSFQISDAKDLSKDKNLLELENVVQYNFESNDNVLKTIDKYISKNKINLLLVDRETIPQKNNIFKVIQKINVPMLVSSQSL